LVYTHSDWLNVISVSSNHLSFVHRMQAPASTASWPLYK
jgi:hypothetical protein